MAKIGCHVSIAGGFVNAPKNAADLKCEVFQIFSRSPMGGAAPAITPADVKTFWVDMKKYGFERFYIHAPYYINMASAVKATAQGSVRILREELERGTKLGAAYVITHIGSARGGDRGEAVEKVRAVVRGIVKGYKGSCKLLLEISAGSGDVIGSTFEEVAEIMRGIKDSGLGGACFDTCHAFASGYALDQKTFADFDKYIGLEKLKVVHANDSKFGRGEKKDRHEHIGKGHIGVPVFKTLLREKYLGGLDWLLETEPDGVAEDILILKRLRTKSK